MLQRSSRTVSAVASRLQKASYLAPIHPTEVLSSTGRCGSLPGHYLGNQGPSNSQQLHHVSQRVLPSLTVSSCLRESLLPDTQSRWNTGQSSCLYCAQPSLSGEHNAFQGVERRENRDNMYYAGRHRPGRTVSAPSGEASRKDGHPFTHSSLVGTGPAFFRASAQRGHGIPAAPARGCTSRSPDWPLPHNHS